MRSKLESVVWVGGGLIVLALMSLVMGLGSIPLVWLAKERKMRSKLESVVWVGGGLIVLALMSLVMGLGSIPLVWLAGGDPPDGISLMFFWWPAALWVAYITTAIDAGWRRERATRYFGHLPLARPGWITTTWLLYYFSPIILSGLSKAFRLVGWNGVSQVLFDFRWHAHFAIPMGIVCLAILCGAIFSGLGWLRTRVKSNKPKALTV